MLVRAWTFHSGEEEGKEDDSQSVASVGEEYEPISDDELDEILADSQKKDDQQDEEKITGTGTYLLSLICQTSQLSRQLPRPLRVSSGPLDVIDVDWSSLMPKQKPEPRAAGAALLRFTPGAVLLRAGVSKRLAGTALLEKVREVCKAELDDPKGESLHLSIPFVNVFVGLFVCLFVCLVLIPIYTS